MANIRQVSKEELQEQKVFAEKVKKHFEIEKAGCAPLAFVRTFGCQQNVSDSERMKGMLAEMGFGFTETPEQADFILFNTCAVREHAVDRVFGNVGALKHIKRRHPKTIIAVCGCMVQQPHVAQKLKEHYPFVGLVFGTHVIHQLPQLLWDALGSKRQLTVTPVMDGVIAEDIPVRRDGTFKAFVPIMYGCNNFCTYCIVPYVRGRERSRDPERILAEVKELVQQGYTDITLLGQNVNSYGKGESHGVNFPALLRKINAIEGDFLIRFMTSHPKDATKELFDTIADCQKISRHFHLPFQSGSDRILKEMNRHYDRAQYLSLVEYARKVVPDITFTSDIIVGFPGETREDFEDTLSLVEQVGFSSLFTFIYSPRVGTPAAQMPDPTPKEEKVKRLQELTDLQERLSAKRLQSLVGTTHRGLIETAGDGFLEVRLSDNSVVRVEGEQSLLGKHALVEITAARSFIVQGSIREVEN
jgi:tRNA-2-methylthio-N6-dimethylallyladenosine synthase